jgi:predicted RND superfamily exporter protein
VFNLENVAAFSASRPKAVLGLIILLTAIAALPLRNTTTDTDPKHMLPESSPVRVHNDAVEADFALHPDVVVVGIVREDGVFHKSTLAHIATLTAQIRELEGVAAEDVTSLATIDDMQSVNGEVMARRYLDPPPTTDADIAEVRIMAMANPLLRGRLVASDGTTTAIYVPLAAGANGKDVADAIRALLPAPDESDGESYHLAGDPVARDTFGAEMFRQMFLFSPFAGMVMCVVLFLLYRSVPLIIANMAVAMVAIVWSMGGLVALGYPVHIMASMSPVFLMAIATDTVHIFNEFLHRLRETPDRNEAIRLTMRAVARPVLYSDLTTAAGFASLATMNIIPVQIFGFTVAAGTLAVLLFSFTLVPAVLALIPEARLRRWAEARLEPGAGFAVLRRLASVTVSRPRLLLGSAVALLIVAGVGLTQIRVNNNMVRWFKSSNPIRVADYVLNEKLGGTATGYLVVETSEGDATSPKFLAFVEGLQRRVERVSLVGRTFSVADYLRRVNRSLHSDSDAFDRIPASSDEANQFLFLLSSFARPSDVANVITPDASRALVHVQLKTWDASAWSDVLAASERYTAESGGAYKIQPAGIAHFNLIWNDEVLWGMLASFLSGCVFVLVLLVIATRSIAWGLLSFIPLVVTVAAIYGGVGLLGKDFDMPVAVLSTLSLGLAVDFAIHFIERYRLRKAEGFGTIEALIWTVERPGRGIFANAALFAAGFAVMMFADLTPYITVGVFMAGIMLLSSVASVVLLPPLIIRLERWKGETR